MRQTKYGNVSCDTLPYSRDSPTEPFMSLIIFPGFPQRHACGSVSIRRRTPLPLFPSERTVASIRLHDGRKRHCPDRRGSERRLSGLRPPRYILNEMPPTKLTSSVAGFQIRLVKNPSFIPSAPLISQLLRRSGKRSGHRNRGLCRKSRRLQGTMPTRPSYRSLSC